MPHQHTNTTEITSPVRSGQNSIHLGSGYLCVHAHPSVFPYTYQTEKQRPKLYMTMKNADIFAWFYTYAHTQAHANKALVVKLYPWDSFNFFENRRYPSLRPLFFSYFVCVRLCLCVDFVSLFLDAVERTRHPPNAVALVIMAPFHCLRSSSSSSFSYISFVDFLVFTSAFLFASLSLLLSTILLMPYTAYSYKSGYRLYKYTTHIRYTLLLHLLYIQFFFLFCFIT